MIRQILSFGLLGLLNILSIYAITPPLAIKFTNQSRVDITSQWSNIVSKERFIVKYPVVSSSVGVVKIHSNVIRSYGFDIHSSIQDYGSRKVGLTISSSHNSSIVVELEGSRSNTFTGKTRVLGENSALNALRTGGAVSISGNLSIENGARFTTFYNNQIARRSKVSLISWSGETSVFGFSGSHSRHVSETISELRVEGNGVIDFQTRGGYGNRFLRLDDLIVGINSHLKIRNWSDGRDHLLVSKDSINLEDTLKRIEFEGYDSRRISLKSFDKDYWEISGLPEPATYGAIFGAVGFGLTAWRKRRRLKGGQWF